MNLYLSSPLFQDSYFSSAITLAITLTSFLLLIKFLAVFWLNDVIVFGAGEQHIDIQVPKVVMSTVNIPFTFHLNDKLTSTYDEVNCIISSEVSYRLEVYWGVSIAQLHYYLRQPWTDSTHSFLNTNHYQHYSPSIKHRSHDSKCIKISLLDNKLKLGIPPRQVYPLVVFIVRDDSAGSAQHLQPHETVALVNIIHIKDETCTLSTSLLAQYLKQADGRLTTLKQLYVESANLCSSEGDKKDIDGLCIVCQVYPISRALLHCRHTCICAVCFTKINACPLCRSPIASYFVIRNEDYYIETEKSQFSSDENTFSNWFQDRITDLLGFER